MACLWSINPQKSRINLRNLHLKRQRIKAENSQERSCLWHIKRENIPAASKKDVDSSAKKGERGQAQRGHIPGGRADWFKKKMLARTPTPTQVYTCEVHTLMPKWSDRPNLPAQPSLKAQLCICRSFEEKQQRQQRAIPKWTLKVEALLLGRGAAKLCRGGGGEASLPRPAIHSCTRGVISLACNAISRRVRGALHFQNENDINYHIRGVLSRELSCSFLINW